MSWALDVERARGLSRAEWRLVVEAVVWLALSRVAVSALPFRRVVALLRLVQTDPAELFAGHSAASGAPIEKVVDGVGWAVRAAATHTPWANTCLVQSVAAHAMLAKRRVESVLYLGVAKDPSGDFIAHSWLRCGGEIVTGAEGASRFSPIASYQRVIRAGR